MKFLLVPKYVKQAPYLSPMIRVPANTSFLLVFIIEVGKNRETEKKAICLN